MFQTEIVENIKTHILSWISCPLWDNVEKYGTTRQGTDYNILRRMRIACWINKATSTYSEYVILMLFHGNNGSAKALGYYINMYIAVLYYTGCPTRRNGQNFGRVFLMLNSTDITQNTYIQSWTVTKIMAIEKSGLLGCPRTVRRPWRHTHPLRMPGNETPLANIVMQWPWQDNGPAAACVKYLET